MCEQNCAPGEGCFYASQIRTQRAYLSDQVYAMDQAWLFVNFPNFLDRTREYMIDGQCHKLAFAPLLAAFTELKLIQAKYKLEHKT